MTKNIQIKWFSIKGVIARRMSHMSHNVFVLKGFSLKRKFDKHHEKYTLET